MVVLSCGLNAQISSTDLRQQLRETIGMSGALVGVSVLHIEKGETLTVNNRVKFPMQSVYKFPLAIAVLHQVDLGKISLEQKVHITKEDMRPHTWSPMASLYPNGNVDVTVAELLQFTVSQSDNNTCDVLFKLLGGTKPVEKYFHQLGYKNISIKALESEMKNDTIAQTNWCYPSEMSRILNDFYQGKHLSAKRNQYLMQLMVETSNSAARIKGKMPPSIVVAHKTGTGNRIVNDAGIITLPDGNHVALSVFVQQASIPFEASEQLIAQVSKNVYDYYLPKPVLDSVAYVLDSAFKVAPFYGNILITQHGETLLEKSYGYADVVKQTPLTPSNSFQVASISKQFTAYGIMLLQEQDKLGYDSAIQKYLPTFPYANITIRHLLNHTSGLPNFWDSIRPKMDTTKSLGNKDVLKYLGEHRLPLQFTPGTRFEYCDIGYDFLANIIEQVSGKRYDEYLRLYVFDPLGMKETYAYLVTDIERINNPNLAIGHVKVNGRFEYAHRLPQNHFVSYLGGFYGDGSVVTTARDLAKWDRALDDCMLMFCAHQKEAFDAANIQDSTTASEGRGYGFGWFLHKDMVYHTGFHPGNVHGNYRLLDRDMVVIFLSNSETPDIRKLRNRVLQLANKKQLR